MQCEQERHMRKSLIPCATQSVGSVLLKMLEMLLYLSMKIIFMIDPITFLNPAKNLVPASF